MVKSDDLITSVFHAGILDIIPILSFGKVMGWAVYINHCLMVIIREVRPGHAGFEEDLCPCGQAEVLCVEEPQPILFQLGFALLDQIPQVILTTIGTGRNFEVSPAHGEEVVADKMAVQQFVIPLVAIRHYAIVTSRLARLF